MLIKIGLVIPYCCDKTLLSTLPQARESWGFPIWPRSRPCKLTCPWYCCLQCFPALLSLASVVSLYTRTNWYSAEHLRGALCDLQSFFLACALAVAVSSSLLSGTLVLWTLAVLVSPDSQLCLLTQDVCQRYCRFHLQEKLDYVKYSGTVLILIWFSRSQRVS